MKEKNFLVVEREKNEIEQDKETQNLNTFKNIFQILRLLLIFYLKTVQILMIHLNY